MLQLLLMPALALGALAQGTTVPFFIGEQDNFHTPLLTGSVVTANLIQTIYAFDCPTGNDIFNGVSCSSGFTVTAGPSSQVLTVTVSDTTASVSCTFTDSTEGACEITQQAPSQSNTLTMKYNSASATSGHPFPGFVQASITAGADKLGATAGSTQTASQASASSPLVTSKPTASHSGTTAAKTASPSASPSASATPKPNSAPSSRTDALAYGLVAFVAAVALL